MNWFSSYFQSLLNSDAFLYNIAFPTKVLLFTLLALALISFVKRNLNLKKYGLSALIGLGLVYLCHIFPTPLSGLFAHPRVQFLSMESILYILCMILGYSLTASIIAFKKRRSLESISYATSLAICSTLLFSYHMVIINGGLKASVKNNEDIMLEIVFTPDAAFDGFCQATETFKCFSGNLSDFENLEIPDELKSVRNELKKQGQTAFRHSNVATVAKDKFSAIYAENGTQFRLLLDQKQAQYLFDSHRMQFYLFTNAATIFWFFGPLLLVLLHKRMFRNKKRR